MDKFRQMLRGKQRVFICMSMRWTSSDRCLKAEQRVFMCLSMRWTSSDRRLEGNKGCLYVCLWDGQVQADTYRETKGVYTYIYDMDKFRQTLRGKQRVFICMQSWNPTPTPLPPYEYTFTRKTNVWRSTKRRAVLMHYIVNWDGVTTSYFPATLESWRLHTALLLSVSRRST